MDNIRRKKWLILIVSLLMAVSAILLAIVFSNVSSEPSVSNSHATTTMGDIGRAPEHPSNAPDEQPSTSTSARPNVTLPEEIPATPTAPTVDTPSVAPTEQPSDSPILPPEQPLPESPAEKPLEKPIEKPAERPSEDSPADTPEPSTPSVDTAFGLDMFASVNPEVSTIIDVVISIKDIGQPLDAVEFTLRFDKRYVAGLITESGASMDCFMTVMPTYTLAAGGMEFPVSRYEQICKYDGDSGVYICRFLDSLTYPSAKPGESYSGLIRNGDLVVTIPFRILGVIPANSEILFSVEDARGTTRTALESVYGQDASCSYFAP